MRSASSQYRSQNTFSTVYRTVVSSRLDSEKAEACSSDIVSIVDRSVTRVRYCICDLFSGQRSPKRLTWQYAKERGWKIDGIIIWTALHHQATRSLVDSSVRVICAAASKTQHLSIGEQDDGGNTRQLLCWIHPN